MVIGPSTRLKHLLSSHPTAIFNAVKCADLLLLLTSGLMAFYLRHGTLNMSVLQLGLLCFVPLTVTAFFYVFGAYSPQHPPLSLNTLNSLFFGSSAAICTLVLMGYASKTGQEFSRLWLLLWAFLAAGHVLGLRWGLQTLYGLTGVTFWERKLAIIGTREMVEHLEARLGNCADALKLVWVKILPDDSSLSGTDLRAELIQTGAETILLAIPGQHVTMLETLITELAELDVDIDIVLEASMIKYPFARASFIAGIPVLRVLNRPWSRLIRNIKWIEDKIGAAILFLVALPIMAIIALALKWDSPGPVIFRQIRNGLRNEEFTLFKFRTMYHLPQGDTITPTIQDDPRVTRLGRFLRRSSLDELPQLWNVLKGQMSLVGPRPHAIPHAQGFAAMTQSYHWRARVLPGMTGWAQINGCRSDQGSAQQLERQIALDLWYIENWSVTLDILILLKSLALCFYDRNAY